MAKPRVFVVYADHGLVSQLTVIQQQFIPILEGDGFEVRQRENSKHFADSAISEMQDKQVRECDFVVAIVEEHSTTVGEVIKDAQHAPRPVLCLCKEGREHEVSRSV